MNHFFVKNNEKPEKSEKYRLLLIRYLRILENFEKPEKAILFANKKILCSQFPEISSAQVANCVMRITIDTRHDSPGKRLPVCISFYFQGTGERYFHPLGASVTREQYIAIAKANGRGRVSASNDLNESQILFKERQKYKLLFNSVRSRIVALAATTTLTASTVQMALNGIGGETSFLEVWQTLAERSYE